MAQAMASRLARAGLRGPYAAADCPLGRELHRLAAAGRGAYLWGEPGRGKTWAAACCARLWVEAGGDAWLVSAKGLLDGLKRDYDDGTQSALRRACTAPLLALDDLGAERATEWSQEAVESVLDERLARGLPTVVTSNFRPGELRDLWGGMQGKRLASRLVGLCGAPREVTGPDMRLAGAAGSGAQAAGHATEGRRP